MKKERETKLRKIRFNTTMYTYLRVIQVSFTVLKDTFTAFPFTFFFPNKSQNLHDK